MKSITIHNIDDQLDKRIKEKAQEQGLSLNKTIKELLRTSVGLSDAPITEERKKQLMGIFGTWSKQEEDEFNEFTKDFEKVDTEE